MFRQIGLLIALGFGGLLAAGQQSSRPEFHVQREAADDLEVAGLVRGVPPGESRFVSRVFLASLPQVTLTIQENADFERKMPAGMQVKGVYLDALARLLGADDSAVAVAAVCGDGYTSTFSKGYIQKHRPVFVLTIGGLAPHDWAAKNHIYDAGPYFIGYQAFVPSFQVLSHVDRPQEPDGMTKIIFDSEERLFGGIVPRQVAGSNDAAETDGYRIARQNCYRCHNSGEYGGTKAGVSWTRVGKIAKDRPKYFERWVHNPQALRANAMMPPNKDYDKATVKALQRYFATFAVEGQ